MSPMCEDVTNGITAATPLWVAMWPNGVTHMGGNVAKWCHSYGWQCGQMVSLIWVAMWPNGVTHMGGNVTKWCHSYGWQCGQMVSLIWVAMWPNGVTHMGGNVAKYEHNMKTHVAVYEESLFD